MVIPDANILIYTYNPDAPQQRALSAWLQAQLAGRDQIGLTWLTLWAFIRIIPNPKLWPNAPSVERVFDVVDEWLSLPNVVLVQPGGRHATILKSLMLGTDPFKSIASDAALAAIAIENAATLASTDRDFRRFSGLRWVNPLESD